MSPISRGFQGRRLSEVDPAGVPSLSASPVPLMSERRLHDFAI